MSKVLNLDEVASKEEKVLKLRGEEYVMESMTVEDFIEITKKEEELQKLGDKAPISEQISTYRDLAAMIFPTMPKDVVASLKLEQLIAIVGFANSVPEEEAESGKSEKEATS